GRFEYRVFAMDFNDYSEKDEFKDFKTKAGGNEIKADAEFRGYVLNFLAKDGWELEQVVQLKEKLGYFYLRRPPTASEPAATPKQQPDDPKSYPEGDPRRRPRPH